MKCIILHGAKLHSSGELHSDLVNRIHLLLDIISKDKYDLLVITGGISGKAPKSEAEAILDYLQPGLTLPVKLETISKTTVQNIKYTFRLLEKENIESLTVITSKCSLSRFKRLYKYYVPHYLDKVTFMGADNTHPLAVFVREAVLGALYLINPREYFINPFLKVFRS